MRLYGSTMRHPGALLLSAVAVALQLTSCSAADTGYKMKPVLVRSGDIKDEWITQIGNLQIQAHQLEGLNGEWWLDSPLTISCDSQPATIEYVELQTNTGTYPAVIDKRSRTIPAYSDHAPVGVSWRFPRDTPTATLLGASSRIVIHLKVGSVEELADIEYQREKD